MPVTITSMLMVSNLLAQFDEVLAGVDRWRSREEPAHTINTVPAVSTRAYTLLTSMHITNTKVTNKRGLHVECLLRSTA